MLLDAGGAEIGEALLPADGFEEPGRHDEPADPERGCECLAHGASVDDSVRLELLERPDRRAVVAILATPLLVLSGLVANGTGAVPLPTRQEAAALGYLALLVTAVGFALWYSSIERLGVHRAGLFAGLTPVSALLTAAAIGASDITLLRLLGALAIGGA